MNALLALRPCKAFGRSFQASLPCLPLPLYRPSPFLQPLQKNTYHLPFLLLPLHLILSPSHPLQKDNNPSPRTITLASLVKGRWLDGKAQTVVLLRFNCNTPAFFIHQTFCRQDGGIAIPPFAQHHIYASLVKGRCCRPKKFGRLPEGLPHHYPSPLTNPSKTALSHA